MSANGPGQFGGYTPPPPPPSSKKSPWLYVGLGCGALILLTFGGCIAAGVVLKNKVESAMKEPLDPAAIKKSMLDTPIYPGAELDETGTKGGKLGAMMVERIIPADSMGVVAYHTPDPMTKVFSYYEKELKGDGYKTAPQKAQNMDMYQKGGDIIGVQESPGASREGKTVFVLMRFHGVKDKS